jgi:carboxymethylenebutenolidase
MMEKFIEVSIENKSMRSYLALPENNEKPTRGIILIQEAFGVNSHIQDLARRYAKEGFAVIAPEVFHRTAPVGFTCGYTEFDKALVHFTAVTPETLIADSKACFEYLKNTIQVSDVSIIGYCLGGRTAFIVNSALPLRSAIAYYGGGISNHLDLAEKQNAPILLMWGGQDAHIPKTDRIKISESLTKAKKKFTEVEFSWAQHGFFCNERSSFNQEAANQAWAITIQFLKEI